jgi:hypothetical protein
MKEISRSPDRLTAQEEIILYQRLLDCLEKEWGALVASQEEAILMLAAEKEQILEKITGAPPNLSASSPSGPEAEQLQRLKHQVAAAQARNHRLINAALETIQDFLGYLQTGAPGIYHAAGRVEAAPGTSFFHRQV